MAMGKENSKNRNFRIKLLAGNEVVLVEADNYESEIFTPQIVNGRITFLNVLPNRRCNTKNCIMKMWLEKPKNLKEPNVLKSRNTETMSADQMVTMCAPLANSTPASARQRNKTCARPTDSFMATPEPIRRALPAHYRILEKSLPNPAKGVKVSRIYHNLTEKTPKKLGRLVTVSNVQNSNNLSILSGSFRLPCSPFISPHNRRSKVNTGGSPLADSIARWQKVLTPVRTYTRNSNDPVMVRRPVSVHSAKKELKPYKFTPTYLVNPTQAPIVSPRIEIKRRKLVIDRSICISAKAFKEQQKKPLEKYERKSTTQQPISLSFHKPRLYLRSMSMSAFDLLTNSNHNSCMAKKLNEQFRKGCVNKASSTYIKYKVLSTVPPLQDDDQILELSRMPPCDM